MRIIDYCNLVDCKRVVLPGAQLADGIFQARERVKSRCTDRTWEPLQETVKFSDDAFLLATDLSPLPGPNDLHRQIVNHADWVHIQFRVSGDGFENISGRQLIATPEGSCIITRYPKNSVIEREIRNANRWVYACLYIRPRGLTTLMDMPASRFPENASWMALDTELECQTSVLPLHSKMILAVNDILSCAFQGEIRRAYMRAKSVELLTTVLHSIDKRPHAFGHPKINVSSSGLEKLSDARRIMADNLDCTLTLASLARRVGLNRTKLAVGFKQVYGVSVQGYWRDAKLVRARELLLQGKNSVTEVALSLGYVELSSFTRAFSRRFGVLPREFRNSQSNPRKPKGDASSSAPAPPTVGLGLRR
jgi:AraC family transcriptional activator of pyochelin receptor